MNKDTIGELLIQYEPLILRLLKHPLQYQSPKKYDLRLTPTETEDFLSDLQLAFVELCQEYDEARGVGFAYYIKQRLSWKANNLAEKIIKYKENVVLVEHSVMDAFVEEDLLGDVEEPDVEDERLELLKSMIQNLPKRQKQVMQLYYLEDRRVQDISKELGMKKQNVNNNRKAGIRRIKKKLKKDNH